MVVQHILAVRKGRREIKVPVETPEEPKLEPMEGNEAAESTNTEQPEPKLDPEPEKEEPVPEKAKSEPEEGAEKPPPEGDAPESSEAMRTEIVEVNY